MKTSLLVIFLLMIPVEASARVSCLLPGIFCVQTHYRHHVKHKKHKRVIIKNAVVKKVVVKKIVRPPAVIMAPPTPAPAPEEPKRFYFF